MLDALTFSITSAFVVLMYFVDVNKAPFDQYILHGFYGSLGFALLLIVYMFLRISFSASLKEHSVMCATAPGTFGYGGAKQVNMTHKEYDLLKLRELVIEVLGATVGAFVLQWYTAHPGALLVYAAVVPAIIINSELGWVYVLFQSAKGNLRRPWEEHQQTWSQMFSELKRELKQQMSKSGVGGGARRNKLAENRRAASKRQ